MRSTIHQSIVAGVLLSSTSLFAAGPLMTTDGNDPQPIRWNTSNGSIPVYVDGGEAFTFDFDGETVFLSIERANELTAYAFEEWSNVETSTFAAHVAGTIESQIGIADITGDNAADVYEVENGYGFWVIYDTDGSVLEEYFGVDRNAVLGIAFPEWVTEDGEILEATALMNGWGVFDQDTEGDFMAGVFTHEFGHALNLSHSQVNGPMVYQSRTQTPQHPGPRACVDPVFRFDTPAFVQGEKAPASVNETMFPFIDNRSFAGNEQSTVDHEDDIAAISNLYPTDDYLSSTGRISGKVFAKDGNTQLSGLNIIARNVNDPLGDAVSDMSGSRTQGKIGPDGRFTLANLTPGEDYVVYVESITSGGYPTTPIRMPSEQEYWNANESSDPAEDLACESTAITAAAGVEEDIQIILNGYSDGVQYTPLVSAAITDLSKNGKVAAGKTSSGLAFKWDANKGFSVFPEEFKTVSTAIDRNGNNFLVGGVDLDGNDIREPAIYRPNGNLELIGDLNGNTCGGNSLGATAASTAWDMDDSAKTVVGLYYEDTDGDGVCSTQTKGEIKPFVWTSKTGMQPLPVDGLQTNRFIRAHKISGNGKLILGNRGGSQALAWANGKLYDLYTEINAMEAIAANYDGTVAPVGTFTDGVVLFDYTNKKDPYFYIGSVRYCYDIPAISFFGGNDCDVDRNGDGVVNTVDWDIVGEALGFPVTLVSGITDDGSFMVGRAGTARTGFFSVMYFADLGWVMMSDWLEKQGVVEARFPSPDNPLALSASGKTMVISLTGVEQSWIVDLSHVYVCENGRSSLVGFPQGYVNKVSKGAIGGRCEHL